MKRLAVQGNSGKPFKSPYKASAFRGKYVASSRSLSAVKYGRRGVASRETGYVIWPMLRMRWTRLVL